MSTPEIRAKLAKKFGKKGGSKVGGGIRRKHKAARKTTSQDDKKILAEMKKLNAQDIPMVQEVNMFKEDGGVIHFTNPKVQADITSNTFCVSGRSANKTLPELLPGILPQLGPDNLAQLKSIAEQFQQATGKTDAANDDDEDVPELVENFDN
mmetsp:Transcript_123936/g.300947  ORF Transcript_123936/g.300947 Transcript_123936/m.300947 type:complete len:152 (+) Transcript_123936:54-509(+)